MQICPNCGKENQDRNYYCYWCNSSLKHQEKVKPKKLHERYDYLLDLEIVEDNSNDIDFFNAYRSKKK